MSIEQDSLLWKLKHIELKSFITVAEEMGRTKGSMSTRYYTVKDDNYQNKYDLGASVEEAFTADISKVITKLQSVKHQLHSMLYGL